MRLPEDLIDRIRNSVDIVEVISDHVTLARKGRDFIGLCPFHDDRNPSLMVSTDKQIYKCFPCGAGGNAISFLMAIEKVSFPEAVRRLALRAGISLPESREDEFQKETSDVLYQVCEWAAGFYRGLLTKDRRGERARAYLTHRGVPDDVASLFSLGYSLSDWDGLLLAAAKRSLDPPTLEKAGLALPRRSGGGHYDRFRDRLIFPITSATGRVVAFGGRSLGEGEDPKYINSPETPVYHKGGVLYGLWQAKDAIRNRGETLVVEGYMDLIRLVGAGIENVVATAGTALTSGHTRLLRRFCDRAVLIFDGDAAGSSASIRGIDILLEAELSARVVTLPEGHDPDSFVRDKGSDAFLRLVEHAEPVLDYKLRSISNREDLGTVDGKVRAATELAQTVSRIQDPIRRGFLVREIAERLGADERIVSEAVGKARDRGSRGRRTATVDRERSSFDPSPHWERTLVGIALSDDAFADRLRSEVSVDVFSNATYRRIADLIVATRSEGRSARAASLISASEDAFLSDLISELSLEGYDETRGDRVIEGYLQSARRASVQRQLNEVAGAIKHAEKEGRSQEVMELLSRHRQLNDEIHRLEPVSLIEARKGREIEK